MKRSSCDSGTSGKVPSARVDSGWRTTMKGSGRRWLAPSTVTCCSAMASSRALCSRRAAIDFIGQQHLGEDRAGVKSKRRSVGQFYRYADQVGGQQMLVNCASEAEVEGGCQRLEASVVFADAGQILQQQMAPASRHQRQPNFRRFAQQYLIDLGFRRHAEAISSLASGSGIGHGPTSVVVVQGSRRVRKLSTQMPQNPAQRQQWQADQRWDLRW